MSTSPQPEGQGQPQPAASITPQVIREAPPPPPPRRRSAWGRILMVLVVLALAGSLMFNLLLMVAVGIVSGAGTGERKLQEKYFAGNPSGRDKIAIISVEGMILEAEDGFVKRQIDQAMRDENVKAVVLRVDSPGGSVTGSDYIYHHLRELKQYYYSNHSKIKRDEPIPIVVSMGGMAASGGYYVSMAVGDTPETIFAEPTGFTGSIGVIIPHYNLGELMDKYGIKSDPVYRGDLKTMGSLTRPMSEKERDIFQSLVDDSYERFTGIVHSGRPKLTLDKIKKLATGQIYTADQAKANGLIDDVGFIEKAIDRAITLADLDKDNVEVVKYKQDLGLASVFLGNSQVNQKPALDLQALLDMTTPRAYYLCSWLPGLESAKR